MTLARSRCGVTPSWTSTLARPRSPSKSRARCPARATAWARVIQNQVLPTPPLPEATAMTSRLAGRQPQHGLGARGADQMGALAAIAGAVGIDAGAVDEEDRVARGRRQLRQLARVLGAMKRRAQQLGEGLELGDAAGADGIAGDD